MNFRKEHTIYSAIWAMLYASPVINIYTRMAGNPRITFSWTEILHAWEYTSTWLVMFAIHNFLLLPILLKKRKTGTYLCLSFLILLTGMFITYLNRPMHKNQNKTRMEAEWEADSLAYERVAAVRLGDGRYCSPQNPMRRKPLDYQPIDPLPMLGPGELVAFFGGLLLMGMNLGVKLYFMSQRDRERQKIIDQRNLEQQMEYLKYQVNPHFFMNTLNNIHALVDIDPERAKTTIVELSKMMRHILYEGSKKLIPLTREVEFLNLYVQLMRLRYTRKVHINVDVPPQLPELKLPPLMLIIFVENAFKHGISYREESFIDIKLRVENKRLLFSCCNSKPTQVQRTNEKGGMGLQNVRQRLELLYDDDYTLDISDGEKTYEVKLDIPMQTRLPDAEAETADVSKA
ncbi:MAG: histidine kinase [Prevotella sp.]|uniref:sensor histidine kinase n=1 Tax=Leyella stercorea TaxID=363265 RepID=UPI0028030C91|nr:histidine kinase [Leyella stercorea]MDY3944584.1 histidine kinase [Prevotella sp.]MDY4088997.1 histidine kinase [Prevotella sp.]